MSTAPAAEFSIALLADLIRGGVRDLVVCPGSRSQALALAAAAAESGDAVRLHVRVDERSAGFFALGVARETGVPAPIIVTSGTAVANLVPAALEAHEARVPMLLLTADRPDELRGIRSNQTTRQGELISTFARLVLEVPAPTAAPASTEPPWIAGFEPDRLARTALQAARGTSERPAGPVQLNLAFREPLSGPPLGGNVSFGTETMTVPELFGAARAESERGTELAVPPGMGASALDGPNPEIYVHDDDVRTVVIAGADAGDRAEAFAHDAGLPLLAEVVSGVRFGREAVTAYATLLDDPELGGAVERAIVFGHPTLTRHVPALLKRDGVEVVVVDPHLGRGVEHYDPSGAARVVRTVSVGEAHDPRAGRQWLGAWIVADRALREARSTVHEPDLAAALAPGYRERSDYARAEVAVMREPVTRELLAESVWRATWPHDRLVVAASRLVRVLDGIAPPRRIRVVANRGLAGIDGTVATALGVAAVSQSADDPRQAAGTTRVLIGDLALMHDAGSLLLDPEEPRPRIQVFVGVDGGGTIFDGLEVAATADRDSYRRVMTVPRSIGLRELAEAYGWAYERAATRSELDRIFTAPVMGPTIVEVPLVE
ncbi:2-succinyl-5-enolpyruvyl-6-hydroxy-3-cyclohexene-1-carboxylic-acid synthase [Leucobacter sp. OLJS4]|uniref:2-succinyl-5-enolpyruvyl-6-hydroxy-3- cyclohexene-1-carboxylic-acid synthase n=1 Tax=unclassified Leucobacter TaxID=2621730 RepID=UPI000C18AD6C|nr:MULTISPECIES: 2-succinyl-5-enolpyruvyl-6-hydroxy-3-cyclohexene-1-carboxylic-acid synthase [unclassified Leucobacter]PII87893.1 2-succinyl-5-enolpyruvyl-6-hydroxy-3-cyclohexene-1-carboxylic-acid synthase [Leucobacter sp. OLCALW19]PII92877.1 2-succinyl-5-enolpyruvyl-6-hydroxy-3-cyclohexene-1-carboxylic-acid synthase [Leucobacter sp. OLAS13]PII96544.1 2-succinyl-5-enolpyruvyl-6-hydroxy-3-cyclohexene-1-carboxylic-acid synthase [Leucobacter sp. OLCS4]PII99125.1 2-succinyl-5-enolpyruvyl-6-hydroxy-